MTTWLKQSTATDVELGPFVDDTDGKTAETGLTISQADCQLIKNGGAAAQKNDATSATHLAGGHYKVPLNTTDTNTLGRLRLYVNESGALPVWRDFMVLPANTYDSLVGGSDYLDVSAVQIAGSAVSTTTAQIGVNVVQISEDATAANNAESFFDGTGYAGTNNVIPTVTTATNVTTVNGLAAGVITAAAIATNAIDADALAADAVTEIQSGLATAAALTTIDDFLDTEIAAILADTNELQTDWVNGGRLDLLIDAIKAKTDNLPTDPADDSDIDTQLAAIAGYLDTEIAAIKAKTDNLPASPAAVGSAMTLAADAVNSSSLAASAVTEIQSGLATAAGVASLNNLSAAQVNAEVVDALSVDTYGEPGSVPAATSSLEDKIGWLFMLARNARTTTATTDAVRNDANSANVATSTLNDDGTTFTRGEYS